MAGSGQTLVETVSIVPHRSDHPEEITMYVAEPVIRFESQPVASRSVPAGLTSLLAVLSLALVLLVIMLAVTPGITRICPAPRAGTAVHLAR
jgi:hypothetical protein